MSWTTEHEHEHEDEDEDGGSGDTQRPQPDRFLDSRHVVAYVMHWPFYCYCDECQSKPDRPAVGEWQHVMVMN